MDSTPARAWGVLGAYALTHAAVDAACAVLLWTSYADGHLSSSTAWSAFFVYNLLAFAVQPVVGAAVDRLHAGKAAAVAGAAMTAAALVLVAAAPAAVWPAVILAGSGNAVFHVGGGVVSLRAAPGRAGPVGVFVAPGAAGLAFGIAAGKAGAAGWPFAAALACLAAVLWVLSTPSFESAAAMPGRASPRAHQPGARRTSAPAALATAGAGVIMLLLAVICVRSFVGLTLAFPWKKDLLLLAALTAAVVAGKAAGGLLADRFGWRTTAVAALVGSLPLLLLGAASPAVGIAGAFLFNMTMPVTLAAVVALLPRGAEGFAFGLTCLALFLGAAPTLLVSPLTSSPAVLVALVVPAAAVLWIALGGGLRYAGRAATATFGAPAATVEGERS